MKKKKGNIKSYNVQAKKVNLKAYGLELVLLLVLAFLSPVLLRRFAPAVLEALQLPDMKIRLLAAVFAVVVVLMQFSKATAKANKRYMKGKEMGTARFEEVETFTARIGDENPSCNMVFSMNGRKSLDSKKTLLNNNTLVIGGSGAGKTAGFIAVNLLQNYGSNVITDPKGDTARDFGVALEKKGRVVKKLDLTEMETSLQYNPFKYIQDEDELGELVDNIISNTTDPDAKGGDPFWENAEAMFDKFLFYFTWLEFKDGAKPYYKYTPYKINDQSESVNLKQELPDMIEEMLSNPKFRKRTQNLEEYPDGYEPMEIFRTPVCDENGEVMTMNASFRTVLLLLNEAEVKDNGASDLDCRVLFLQQKIKAAGKLPESNPAIANYNKTMRGAADTVRSIVISANARFDKFANESLLRILDDDELELESLCTGKVKGREGIVNTDLFLVIPDDKTTYNFVVGMVYTQMFQRMYAIARKNHGKCPVTVGMWMDEFANIKMPSNFKQILATCRSREIYIVIILQALAQLKTLYPQDEWEEIVGNCDAFLYLGGNEQSSHKYVSELLGKMTIDKQTQGQTLGRQGSSSTNEDVHGRELMNDQEVSMLPNTECIFRVRGFYPVRDKKCYWFLMPEYAYIKKFDKWNTKVVVKKAGDRYITIKEDELKEMDMLPGDFLFFRENVEAEKRKLRASSFDSSDMDALAHVDLEEAEAEFAKRNLQIEKELLEYEKKLDDLHFDHLITQSPFSDEQFALILSAREDGFSAKEILKFAKPDFGLAQMKLIKELVEKERGGQE